MASLISPQAWAEFEASQHRAHETFMTKEILWKKRIGTKRSRYGEDVPSTFENRYVKALCNFNYMRSWPSEEATETGKIDRQSIQILFSKKMLADQGWLTPDGNMDYDDGHDWFIVNGISYFAGGDTPASQAYSDDLLFCITVRPQEVATQQLGK